jgi:adenine-specific DNA-methyltransferase
VKFRRQQPIGPYIVDFVSFERKLVVEIDGGQHNEDTIREQDEAGQL